MAKSSPRFRGLAWRVGNVLTGLTARLGVGPVHLLTTRGRRSRRTTTVPVVPVDGDGRRWLVAPYGTTDWVRNARASGRVGLRHGRDSAEYLVRETGGSEAGPVLKRYVKIAPKARSHFAAKVNDPVDAFTAEAYDHPVFELVRTDT